MRTAFYSLHKNDHQQTILNLQGRWIVSQITEIEQQLAKLEKKLPQNFVIHGKDIKQLDTVGIWALLKWLKIRQKNLQLSLEEFPEEYRGMIERVQQAYAQKPALKPQKVNHIKEVVIHVGETVVAMLTFMMEFTAFLGLTLVTFLRNVISPKQWKLAELSRHIEETGVNAIPITAGAAFLISVVLAYQGAYQLRQFGADIYTVDLVAISLLREMGVLVTSILVAGRSGSAFATEIGVMKVTQEVDALRTLGLSPFNILVMPRVMALIITLPLLTFLADMTGLLGGAMMIYILMDITWIQFVNRLQEAIVFSTYWVGLVKAPFFAMIIALVGCLRGMQASGSAEKVGQLTTKAVVESITLIIVADAIFSILFTKWKV